MAAIKLKTSVSVLAKKMCAADFYQQDSKQMTPQLLKTQLSDTTVREYHTTPN